MKVDTKQKAAEMNHIGLGIYNGMICCGGLAQQKCIQVFHVCEQGKEMLLNNGVGEKEASKFKRYGILALYADTELPPRLTTM